MQVIEFRWAQLIWERFKQRDLQFLGSEYMPCGHLPSRSALVFVENHDRQSDCHVPDPEVPCNSLTYKDGELYKVGHQAKVTHSAALICKRNNVCTAIAKLEILRVYPGSKTGTVLADLVVMGIVRQSERFCVHAECRRQWRSRWHIHMALHRS